MARTYTIRVTDDETGVVIFAGRPTTHLQMVLASDEPGRLRCVSCTAGIADDLAAMDAEGPVDGQSEDDDWGEDGTARACQNCDYSVWRTRSGRWVARGTDEPWVCPGAPYGHAPLNP